MQSIPIEENNNSTTNNLNKKSFTCIFHVPIHLNDSISAMDILSNILIIGTNIGAFYIVHLNSSNSNQHIINHIFKRSEENINSISFQSSSKVNISIGDVEVKIMNIDNDIKDLKTACESIKNYTSHKEHAQHCLNATCILSQFNFFKANTIFCQDNPLAKIKINKIPYENKSLLTSSIRRGEISMSNFSVPFDFDGDRFVFIDYISETIRRLCIHYTLSNCEPVIIELDNSFGHVSHIKLLPYNKIFLVRNKVQCEIREESVQFKLIESFTHIGNEVTATYVYNTSSLNQSREIDDREWFNGGGKEDDISRKDVSNRSSQISVGLSSSQKTLLKVDSKIVMMQGEFNKRGSYVDNNNNVIHNLDSIAVVPMLFDIEIGTLDENGNFNIYKNGKENLMFNLNNIENINIDYKEKEFFSIGFPYYICFNSKYYVISTDHGAFIIGK